MFIGKPKPWNLCLNEFNENLLLVQVEGLRNEFGSVKLEYERLLAELKSLDVVKDENNVNT